MTPEKIAETWKEICFILSKSVSPTMNEKEYEYHVVKAIETLGWKEFKNEIKRQSVINIGHGNKLIPDLVVYGDKNKPLIAIEIKKPTDDLTKDGVYSQLQSYMRQLKTEFGLAIGKTIRLFYDGKLYPQNEPVLLDELKFDEDSAEAQEFVTNINKESLTKGNHIQYLENLINKVKEGRDIEKLKKELVSKDTKKKVLAYLKEEFIEYGSEIVEGALKSMEIQIRSTELPGKEIKPTKSGLKGNTLTDRVLDFIQTSQAGVNRKEISDKLNITGKQASNRIYRLKKKGLIRSDDRGIWIATYSKPIKKPTSTPTKHPGKPVNIREKVFKAVARYKKGATTQKIIERTGFEKKQIRNALHALKKKGKISSVERNLFKAV